MKVFTVKLAATMAILLSCSTPTELLKKAEEREPGIINKKSEEQREKSWPPILETNYNPKTVASALQQSFKEHYFTCFSLKQEDKDYIPDDVKNIEEFRLNDSIIQVDEVKTGFLMYYVFSDAEINTGLSSLNLLDDQKIELSITKQFDAVQPVDYASTYFVSKTCTGYLKAFIAGEAKPPYLKISGALNADETKKSTFVGISGKFVSPLPKIIDKGGTLSTYCLMKLWDVYQKKGLTTGNYLKQFNGIATSFLKSHEKSKKLALSGALDFSGALNTNLAAGISVGESISDFFEANKWSTLIYVKNNRSTAVFDRLPDAQAIATRLSGQKRALPPDAMVEGNPHYREVFIPGIPDGMIDGYWEVTGDFNSVYSSLRIYSAKLDNEKVGDKSTDLGCRFVLEGIPVVNIFQSSTTIPLKFKIQSKNTISNSKIIFNFDNEYATTTDEPKLKPVAKSFQPSAYSRQENGLVAIQWEVVLDVEDERNIVDYSRDPTFEDFVATRESVEIKLKRVSATKSKKKYSIVVETVESYPMDKINPQISNIYSLSNKVKLPRNGGGATFERPFAVSLIVPNLSGEK